jgi:hypothetical protein
MPPVALVRCDRVEHVVEDDEPCTMLCAKLVMPVHTAHLDSGEGEYQAVEWVNQNEDKLPKLPRPGATVCLVPYPHGVAPSLIVGDCRVYKVWAGPVLFLFCLYDAQFDASGFLGKVFVVREI